MKDFADRIEAENAVLMDGDCIYCSRFSDLIAARNTLGSLAVMNLRDRPDLVAAMREAGLDPNQGMVFKRGDQIYFGHKAVVELARVTEDRGALRRTIRKTFHSEAAARLLYPLLRAGRAATLLLRGKRMID